MAEVLPIQRKTSINQSINQSINRIIVKYPSRIQRDKDLLYGDSFLHITKYEFDAKK